MTDDSSPPLSTSKPPASKPPASKQPSSSLGGSPLGASSATAADDQAAVALDVRRARASRGTGRATWLWVALPVGGLLVVPMFGLFYTATTSFGKDDAEASASASSAESDEAEDEDDEPAGAGAFRKTSKKTSRKKSKAAKGSRPRADSAAVCCAKLHELGKTEEVENRSRYLSAAAACEAAPNAETAFRRVASSLRIGKVEGPPECESE